MKQAIKRYDLLCLGGGPAAVPCARRAAAYGKKACIIERDHLGGTCLNKGCTPKKIFHNMADLYNDFKAASTYGLTGPKPGFFSHKTDSNVVNANWALMQQKNREFIGMVNSMVGGMCKQLGIEVVGGTGKLIDAHTVEVATKTGPVRIEADHILLATGSIPIMPKIDGIEHAVTSDRFFEMQSLPESIAIIGGGYIGVEIASCLNTFGVKTHVLMLEDGILPAFDSELSGALMKYLVGKGIKFHPKSQLMGIQKVGGSRFRVMSKSACAAKSIETSMVMMAVGRKPNTAGFGFEEAGIKLGKHGEILVDEYDTTSIPNIFSVGDANGKIPLTPVAKTASKLLADRLFGPGKQNKALFKMDYEDVPSVAYSDPPIGKCGLTEQQAKVIYGANAKVYKHQGFQLSHALTKEKEPFMVKIVTAKQVDGEKVVGINALGRNVDEMLVGFSMAMKKGLTAMDLCKTVTVHPTGVEEFTNMF